MERTVYKDGQRVVISKDMHEQEEVFTGRYLVSSNGSKKKIYSKCISSTTANIASDINSLSMDMLIRFSGWAWSRYNNIFPIPNWYSNEEGYRIDMFIANNTSPLTIAFNFKGYFYASGNVVCFLEYTKTTG